MPTTPIPDDFPRDQRLGALTGVQPKLPAMKVGDTYVVGLTEEELAQRYDICLDLVRQLVAYCQRKQRENPAWTREYNVDRSRRGLVSKVKSGIWHFSDAEVTWVMKRVDELLG